MVPNKHPQLHYPEENQELDPIHWSGAVAATAQQRAYWTGSPFACTFRSSFACSDDTNNHSHYDRHNNVKLP